MRLPRLHRSAPEPRGTTVAEAPAWPSLGGPPIPTSHHPDPDPVEGFRVLGTVDALRAGYRWGSAETGGTQGPVRDDDAPWTPRWRDPDLDGHGHPDETALTAEVVDTEPRWAAAATPACDFSEPPAPQTDTGWAHPRERHQMEVLPANRALPALRQERAMLALAARTEVLTTAVERLQSRLDEVAEQFVDVVTHSDLVEIESRRARLAAEVSRMSIELRAELDRRISDLGRAIAEAGHRAATVDCRGPLELADDRRIEMYLDRLEALDKVTHLAERQTA